jgi:hypothetical protein
MKIFVMTLLAVLGGIWLYNKAQKKKSEEISDEDRAKLDAMFGPGNLFSGTKDPITGDNTLSNARPGTVSFSAQDN